MHSETDARASMSWAGTAIAAAAGSLVAALLLWGLSLEFKWAFAILGALTLGATVAMLLLVVEPRQLLLGLAVISVPLGMNVQFLHRIHMGGAPSLAFTLTDCILIIALATALTSRVNAGNGLSRILRNATPMLALLVVASVSLLVARDPVLGVFELVAMLRALLFYATVAALLRTERDLVVTWLCVSLVIVLEGTAAALQQHNILLTEGAWAFLGAADPSDANSFLQQDLGGSVLLRPSGTLGHPNRLGLLMVTLIPISAAGVGCYRRGFGRNLALGACALGTFALLVSLSRSAWGGFLVAGAVLTLYLSRWLRPRHAGLGLLLFLCVAIFAGSRAHEVVRLRMVEDDAGSASSRWLYLGIAGEVISEHPLLGVGLNNYGERMYEYRRGSERDASIIVLPVHNVFLLTAAEMGIGGGLCLAWLLIRFLRLGKGIGVAPPTFPRAMTAGSVAGIAGYTAVGMVNLQQVGSDVMFWLVAAVAFASKHLWTRDQQDRKSPLGSRRGDM